MLEIDVEGWPIAIRGCVLHLEKPTRDIPWQVVTPTGEHLDCLKPVNGGPLDRLITELVNRHLAALNDVGPDIDPECPDIVLGGKVPELAWEWQSFGYGLHLLSLWADGWPVQVDAKLSGIQRDPDSGEWHAITNEGHRLESVEKDPGAIGGVATQLFNERLALLRSNDAALTRRKPRRR